MSEPLERWVTVEYRDGPRAGTNDRFLTHGQPPTAIATGEPVTGVYRLAGPAEDPHAWVYEYFTGEPDLPTSFDDVYPRQ